MRTFTHQAETWSVRLGVLTCGVGPLGDDGALQAFTRRGIWFMRRRDGRGIYSHTSPASAEKTDADLIVSLERGLAREARYKTLDA